ncbi:histidine--tRNA ligase [Pseudomonadota bacterium]|nr:histidine--tRNA ligase [Pseudomonadota bacterium]
MKIQSLRGMPDLFPDDLKKWHMLEKKLYQAFDVFNIQEIRTPILESTELFDRSVGNSSDIVNKELYSFLDRNQESISLRPEGSASVIRAIIQKKQEHEKHKLWYQGPMFRYERPQKGRFRQFHQVGIEYLGYEEGLSEYEIIALVIKIIDQLGISGSTLKINHLGDEVSKENFCQALQNFFKPHLSKLHKKDIFRLNTNPLRILDSKENSTQVLLKDAPNFEDFISHKSKALLQHISQHFSDQCNINIDSSLVRGLDYYTGLVFEVVSDELGAQDAFLGGGRYDNLSEELGGKSMHALGFAIGLERVISLMQSKESNLRKKVALIIVDEQDHEKTYKIAHDLRAANFDITLDAFLSNSSLKSQLRRANNTQCDFALIIGSQERDNDQFTWKDLSEKGHQKSLSFQELMTLYKNL